MFIFISENFLLNDITMNKHKYVCIYTESINQNKAKSTNK